MALVVVGIDGSAGADMALRFALDEARQRGATLRVVCAWEFPAAAYGAAYVTSDLEHGLAEGAAETIDKALDRVGDHDDVEIERMPARGQAAEVLVASAPEPDLLVVGSRGRGGFSSLLLGSVSQQVAHYAQVPVVIVPTAREEG